jgi:hypothetical protein
MHPTPLKTIYIYLYKRSRYRDIEYIEEIRRAGGRGCNMRSQLFALNAHFSIRRRAQVIMTLVSLYE